MSRRQFSKHPEVIEAGNKAFQKAYAELAEDLEPSEARARAHDQRLAAQREMIDGLIAAEPNIT